MCVRICISLFVFTEIGLYCKFIILWVPGTVFFHAKNLNASDFKSKMSYPWTSCLISPNRFKFFLEHRSQRATRKKTHILAHPSQNMHYMGRGFEYQLYLDAPIVIVAYTAYTIISSNFPMMLGKQRSGKYELVRAYI